jgi:hypothetical protein
MTIYEAWEDPGEHSFALVRKSQPDMRSKLGLSADARLLYKIEACSFEEAAAIHSLRMGWGAYHPAGIAKPCPNCGANFYPEGSGECWRCGNKF